MATTGRTNNGSTQATSRRSYIATDVYDGFFFRYSTSLQNFVTIGVLSAVPGAAGNAPAGRILRETGRKLVPGANPGVSNYMVSVYDAVSLLTGFIDPNARVFAAYNSDKPNFLPNDANTAANRYGGLYGPSLLTGGNIIQISTDASGAVTPSFLGVLDALQETKYAEMYQWHGDSNMYVEAHDHATSNRAYLSSDGHAIASRGIGYNRRTVDIQSVNTLQDVHSSSNAPAGILQLASEGFTFAPYQRLSFTLYNSTFGANDYLAIQYAAASTVPDPGRFQFSAQCTAPSTAIITLINNSTEYNYPGGFSLQYILFKTSDDALLEEEPC